MPDSASPIEDVSSMLLQSKSSEDKSFAYSTLLHLQEKSVGESSIIESLVRRSRCLLSIILSDIFDDEEEIAAQALKSLGFMIYHPSIVSTISEEEASHAIKSLVKLIMTTKMKAICNLGVWCISIQQFKRSFTIDLLDSLLRAVVHALDNPLGSLSTTYEATQAVIKLVSEHPESMRNMSNMWAPPIYQKLLSADRRERDMSERCLIKIKSSLLPPTLILSQDLKHNIKKKFLPQMMNMVLECGKHGQTIQAWGWYIRLLGQVIMRNRNLLNEMLKIPEQTFQNSAPQVQTATLVAWEALVDVLIGTQIQLMGTELDNVLCALPQTGVRIDGLSRSTKLIMKPLLRILSRSNNELSVYSSCFNTWRHLLHKIDLVINNSLISEIVFEPVLKVIFRNGPDNGNLWLWNSSVDLLDDFVSSKFRSCSSQAAFGGSFKSGILCEDDPIIKWLPWDCTKLEFNLKMIRAIIDQALKAAVTVESLKLVFDAALKIFRSVLRGVQVDIKKPSTHFSEILMFIFMTVEFVKELCEDSTSNLSRVGSIDFISSTAKFIWAFREEFEPSILESPIYRIPLDKKFVNYLKFDVDIPYLKILRISSLSFEHNVSPSVYLTILYHFMMAHSLLNSEIGKVLDDMENCCNYVFSSGEPFENLLQIACFLYLHGLKHKDCAFYFLKLWGVIARGLKQQINDVGNLNSFQTEMDHTGCVVVYWLLCYPFVMSQVLPTLFPKMENLDSCLMSSEADLELSDALLVWRSLYDSADSALQSKKPTANSFAEDLCEMLLMLSLVDESAYQCMSLNPCYLFVFGEIAMHIIEKGLLTKKQEFSNVKNCLKLTGRFLTMSRTTVETGKKFELPVVSRMFAALASFVGKLVLKEDILSLMEIISDPLVHWLSAFISIEKEIQEGSPIYHLLIFWTSTLDVMLRVQPPIIFNSLLLGAHASVLLAALDHPCSSISDATIAFWNSTYGEQSKLNYPQNLHAVLDRLSRKGMVKLPKGISGFMFSKPYNEDINVQKKHRVAALQTRSSSSVESVEEAQDDSLLVNLHQKRLKFRIEHQEKAMDFGRPIRLVGVSSSADFIPGKATVCLREEYRSTDSILEMLRKTN